MANCNANTDINTYAVGKIEAEFIQGCLNRLRAYNTKYSVAGIPTPKKISDAYPNDLTVRLVQTRTNDIEGTVTLQALKTLVDDIKHTLLDYSESATYGSHPTIDHPTDTNFPDDVNDRDYLKNGITTIEAGCWACYTGHGTDTCSSCHHESHTCSCNSACYGHSCTACHGTTDSCTCNIPCNIHTPAGCTICDSACNGYCWHCSCYDDWCAACYSTDDYAEYLCSGCDVACYTEVSDSCTSCHHSTNACTCDSACYVHGCTACNASADTCSCNASPCYSHTDNCTQCNATTY